MNKQTIYKACRASLFPLFVLFAAALLKTILTISAVMVISEDSDSFYLTVYYFLNEVLSILIPLLVSVLLFTFCRHGAISLLLPWMLVYWAVFVFCHAIETAFYCQLVFDSFFWWESEDFLFLLNLSLESLGAVLLCGFTSLVAYAILPKENRKTTENRAIARSLLVICAVFLIGAFVNECITYTIPELQNVKNGYSSLLPIDAVYIVFKYVFYVALVAIGYLFGCKLDRHFAKRLS